MKDRISDKYWFPWWPDKWIFGSIRIEFSPAERGIWVDMLSLASKDSGHIRANEETPYPIQQLAGMLIIPEDILIKAIDKFVKFEKITKTKAGTLYVTKWEKYQFTERHKRRIENDEGHEFKPKYDRFMPCPEEFSSMATKKGLVRISRLIAAASIGRSLSPNEVVHHLDGDDSNDEPENLILFANNKDHLRFQHGYNVTPIWDGSKEGGVAKNDISAAKKDAIVEDSIKEDITEHNKKEETKKTAATPKIIFNFGTAEFENITEKDNTIWRKAYPACDIEAELNKMAAWLSANPTRKKSNYKKFITNWLSRQQDRGGSKTNGTEKWTPKEPQPWED